jgi:type IV pilus assembly protein PilC
MYVNIVRVGERVGSIEELLRSLVDFIEWQRELERDIKKLVTYPALVMTAIGGIIIALVTFVYPRIGGIFSKMNVDVPVTTRFLLSLADLIKNNIAIEVVIIILLVGGYQFLKRSPRGALFIDSMKLKVPIIGEFRVKVAVSRFTHHLEIMERAGVDISQSLQTAAEAIDNRALAEKLFGAREKVIAGHSLSDALSETGIFPDLVIRMVAMGEMGGSMEDNLKKVSQYYDTEVPAAVKKTLMIIEPIMILFLAGAVLFIAVSLYLPIYKLVDSIKFER